MKRNIFFVILILIAVGFVFSRLNFGFLFQNQSELVKPKTKKDISPTPIPFNQLTIPYLQKRDYQSQLNELNQFSENNNYTSYLTSYNSDDLNINGLLTIPNGNQPNKGWPAIVFIHGYIPPNEYQTTEKYMDYVDYLARNGLVVFKIDLRGHGQSEGNPSGTYYSTDYIIDTLSAYSALQNSDFVDSQKIGLWGHSMAGNIVFRSMVAKQDIKAGVVWAGTVFTYDDFQEFGIDDDSYQPPDQDSPRRQRRQELFDTHGRYNPENSFWQQVTPINYLDDFKGAIQLHHAVNDNVVNIEYSRNINRILNEKGINSQLYEYSNGGHNLASPAFSTAMSRTVEFLKSQFN